MSRRKQIREDVAARLATAITEVSSRVYNARAEAIGEVEIPCICVYTRDEAVETIGQIPTIQSRTLSLAVELLVRGSERIDDDLDDIAEKIESEILDSKSIRPASGLYQGVELEKTEMGFYDNGRKPVGAARLTFNFIYEKTFT